jgi:hypothetical protein
VHLEIYIDAGDISRSAEKKKGSEELRVALLLQIVVKKREKV